MFNLFKKSAAAPEERLAACLAKKDYPGLARAYYDMGKAAMEAGDPGRAMLWLSRADTIYSASNDTYEALGEKLTDDCSNRIGELEEAPLLSNQIVEEVEDKCSQLGDAQVRVWSLLTLARLTPVGERLSGLPGCQVLTNEQLGLDSSAKEAVAFAVLANEALYGCANNAPGATGAAHGVVMGKISL